jgi:hypothetical protein
MKQRKSKRDRPVLAQESITGSGEYIMLGLPPPPPDIPLNAGVIKDYQRSKYNDTRIFFFVVLGVILILIGAGIWIASDLLSGGW